MFCEKCGKKVESGREVCSSCEAEMTSRNHTDSINESATTTVEQTTPKKKGSKKIVLFSIVSLVLIGVVAAISFSLPKGAKEQFLLAEYKNMQMIIEEFEMKYRDDIEFQEMYNKEPSSTTMTLNGGFALDSSEYDLEMAMIQGIIDQATITLRSDFEPENNNSFYNLALNMQETTLMDANFFKVDDQVGLQVPLLYDKYLYLKNDEYGNFMRKLDPYYEGPENLDFMDFTYEDMKLTDEEKSYLKNEYGDYLYTQLKEEYFSVNENVDFSYNGENMKVTELTLQLTQEETEQFVNGLFEKLANDEKLQNMITDRIVKIASIMQEEIDYGDFSNAEWVKAELQSGLNELKDELQNVTFPEGFRATIKVGQDDIIVDRNYELVVGGPYDESVVLNLVTKNVPISNSTTEREISLEAYSKEYPDSIASIRYANTIEENDDRTERMNLTFDVDGEGMTFSMESVFSGDKFHKIDREFDLTIDEYYSQSQISGTITEEKDYNLSNDYANHLINIALSFSDSEESVTLNFAIDSKTEFGNVQFPNMDEEESVNVVELSDEDFMEIGSEIESRIFDLVYNLGIF